MANPVQHKQREIFKAGGTLNPNASSYVTRPADEELLKRTLAGDFCYILTARQMGKSSLMLRTAEQLHQNQIKTAVVDLTGIGTQEITSEQWYLSIIKKIETALQLRTDAEKWWTDQFGLTAVQRFTDFLQEIVLKEITTKIVIFIDEIDSTLNIPFTDDFFAAIRFVYNRRASQPDYNRLTFVLLGVAMPTDLIRDRNRTPFNIAYPINLRDFSRQDAQPLLKGLEQRYGDHGRRILDQIFFWTGGHPYLTQKLCLAVTETRHAISTEAQIDEVVAQTFFTEDGKKDTNLQFVAKNVSENPNRRQLMQIYKKVYSGHQVYEDERSLFQNRLRLYGLLQIENRLLSVRNEIYRQVFNADWIKENMPVNRTRWITIGAVSISILSLIFIVWFVQWQRQQTIETQTQTYIERFNRSDIPDIRLNSLANLCELSKTQEAEQLFWQLSHHKRIEIFEQIEANRVSQKLLVTVNCLSPSLEAHRTDPVQYDQLSQSMCCAVQHVASETASSVDHPLSLNCECETKAEKNNE